MAKRLLKKSEVCRLTGVGDSTIWRYTDLGYFPASVLGKDKSSHNRRWARSDIDLWIKANGTGPLRSSQGPQSTWRSWLDIQTDPELQLATWEDAEEPAAKTKKPPSFASKPKHYLRHVTYDDKEGAKELGARWDGMCWFIPDVVQGVARSKLESLYGPSMYGNHSRRGSGQWGAFVHATANEQLADTLSGFETGDVMDAIHDAWPETKVKQKDPVPGTTNVKPKSERVTPKPTPAGSKRTVTIKTEPARPDPALHYYTVRIPKVLIAAAVLIAVGVGGWFMGRGF